MKSHKDHCYFPSQKQLEKEGYKIVIDKGYSTNVAREYDLAWNAFQNGWIAKLKDAQPVADQQKIPVSDEYRFMRKYFHPLWSWYVLVLRLVTLKNPLIEIAGYVRALDVKRRKLGQAPVAYNDYNTLQSNLLLSKPLVSVIIPTLNRYRFLLDVFKDLEEQTYENFEVIVVDQSEPFQEQIYSNWNFPINFWYQKEKALWKARNEAIQSAKGDLILLYDDDSRVGPDWIEQHLKTMDYFDADISSGVSISAQGARVPHHYSFFRWSDQLDTGNALVKKKVFNTIGLFDRQFEKQRMGDGEFGLRAYLAGFRNVSNPLAMRDHLKVSEGGLRQMGSWDAWRPKSWRSPRPVPSVLYFYRRYFGNRAAMLSIASSLSPSMVPYRFKGKKWILLIIVFLSPLLLPLVTLQVIRSWRQASKKLSHGPIIDQL